MLWQKSHNQTNLITLKINSYTNRKTTSMNSIIPIVVIKVFKFVASNICQTPIVCNLGIELLITQTTTQSNTCIKIRECILTECVRFFTT